MSVRNKIERWYVWTHLYHHIRSEVPEVHEILQKVPYIDRIRVRTKQFFPYHICLDLPTSQKRGRYRPVDHRIYVDLETGDYELRIAVRDDGREPKVVVHSDSNTYMDYCMWFKLVGTAALHFDTKFPEWYREDHFSYESALDARTLIETLG